MAQHALVVHHQADQLARVAGGLLRFQHVAANERAALVQRHRPGQRGFVRGDVFIHVLAVQVHSRFQAQRIARAQPGRAHACGGQRIPEGDHVGLRQQDLETVFTGVAGARHEQRRATGGSRLQRGEAAQLLQRGALALGDQADHPLARGRALHGDDGQVFALGDLHLEGGGLLTDPGQVLFAGGGVDHHAEEVIGQVVHDQVVDDPAARVEHARVQRLAGGLELVHRVGQQRAQERLDLLTAQIHHGHVADVEHAGIAAHQVVLVQLRTVMDGHVPATEINHLGAERAVGIVEERLLGHDRFPGE
ncbi:hypothetical protein D3C71_1306000 [compost metagenome]